mgnify:CR=1 FL=1
MSARAGLTLLSISVATLAALGSAPPAAQAQPADQGVAVLGHVNAVRAAHGCGPVRADPQLTAAAARQAHDMLANGVQGHTGSDGSSVAQRVTAAGYSYAALGEVMFWGTGTAGTPANAVTWWMNSPGHRAVLLDCGLTDAGFSAVSNGTKLAAVGEFGTRQR